MTLTYDNDLEKSQKELLDTIKEAINNILNLTQNLLVKVERKIKEKSKEVAKMIKGGKCENESKFCLDMSSGVSKNFGEPNDVVLEMPTIQREEFGLDMSRFVRDENETISLSEFNLSQDKFREIMPHASFIPDEIAQYIYIPENFISVKISDEEKKKLVQNLKYMVIPYIKDLCMYKGKNLVYKLEAYVNCDTFTLRSFDYETKKFYPNDSNDNVIVQCTVNEVKEIKRKEVN